MALVSVGGAGIYVPSLFLGIEGDPARSVSESTLDADEEEVQVFGFVEIDGGGSKTFGGGSSAIGWLPGPSITFADDGANDPTLRVGVKKASSISTTLGPPIQATAGAAAFDVYKDLIGGTDTITSATWRSDLMPSGTPFTVATGDLLAVCWHLDKPGAAAQSVKVRGTSLTSAGSNAVPTQVLYTGTYANQSILPNCILTFSDGTLGWLSGSSVLSTADITTATIGNTNIYGNIFTLPFKCVVSGIVYSVIGTAAGDHAVEIYTTPLGTPASAVSVTIDNNQYGPSATTNRVRHVMLPAPYTFEANTAYAVGVRQTTATAVTLRQADVDTATHLRALGLTESSCYAATSTAGATFAAANSGKRRYFIWLRVSQVDDGAGAGGVSILNRRDNSLMVR